MQTIEYLIENEGKPSGIRYLERGCSKGFFGAFFLYHRDLVVSQAVRGEL